MFADEVMVLMLDLRVSVCDIGRRLWERGFVASNDGNLSVRTGNDCGHILCTPTMVSKGFMRPEDLPVVDADGGQVSGALRRTGEVLAHVEILRRRPDVNAVVHAHPPHATALSIALDALPRNILPEIELFFDQVPTVPYATPGTAEFAQALVAHAESANAFLLKNHGVITIGQTLAQAYYRMETLDHYCRILILARQLAGDWNRLSAAQVAQLHELRGQLAQTAPLK